MKIVLVRHGKSEFNINEEKGEKSYCGALNTPLSKIGKKEAENLLGNEILKASDEVYSSDLDRAKMTAQIAMPDSNIIEDELLRERSLGNFENHTESEMREKYPEYYKDGKISEYRRNFELKVPGGENYTEVSKRCKEFFSKFDLNEDKQITIFSHMHFICCTLYVLTGSFEKETITKLKIKNCDPIILEGTEIGKFKLVTHKIENNVLVHNK